MVLFSFGGKVSHSGPPSLWWSIWWFMEASGDHWWSSAYISNPFDWILKTKKRNFLFLIFLGNLFGETSLKEHYEPTGHDCILLVKQLVNSESLAQPPMTFLPSSFSNRLTNPLEQLPRNLLKDRARKELLVQTFIGQLTIFNLFSIWNPSHSLHRSTHSRFLKTASLVEKDPWFLTKAAGVLRSWVDT